MAVVGGLPASADRFQVRLHCLCVMRGGAWDGKYGMYDSCADVCAAAWHAVCWDADCLCCRCFNVTMRSRMCADADVCVVQSEA